MPIREPILSSLIESSTIHHIRHELDEAWSGTEPVRFCTIEGNILALTSTPAKNPLDGREVVHEVIYERAMR